MAFFTRNCCRNRRQTQVRMLGDSFIFSAVEITNPAVQTVNAGEEIAFSQSNINSGVSFRYNGGNSIEIISSGVYKISFVGSATTTADSLINLGIAVNGTAQPITEISQSVFAGTYENVKTELILRVDNPSALISVLNTGATNFDMLNPMLSIIRIGNN